MDAKKSDEGEAHESGIKTKIGGILAIAGLIAMVVLVGTAAANGGAEIYGSRFFGDFEERENFTTTNNLYGHGDFGDYSYTSGLPPCPAGCGGRIYVVKHQEILTNGTPLIDVSGGNETVAWGYFFFEMAWPTPLTPGTYDLVLDLNVSGYLGVWTNVTNPAGSGEPYITDPIWTIYVTGPPGPEILIEKTASRTGVCPGSDPLTVNLGDTVTYCYNVTNTGNVTLSNISVSDDHYGTIVMTKTELAPGASTGGMTTHPVTEADVSQVINNATVTGTFPSGKIVTDNDNCTINIEHPHIAVTKTVSPSAGGGGGGGGGGGTGVRFTIGVTNTGDSTLDPVKVEDTLPAGMSYVEAGTSPRPSSVMENIITWNNIGLLNPLASSIITLAAHIESGASGTRTNIVNVTGTSPTGYKVTDSATADVKVEEPAQVPEFTSVGIIALIGLLSIIAALSIKRRE